MSIPANVSRAILLNSTYPTDIKANCSAQIVVTTLYPPPVAICNWRVSVARDCSLICVEYHEQFKAVLLGGAIFAGILTLMCIAQVIFRQFALKRYIFSNGQLNPIEGLFFVMIFFTAARCVHNVLVIYDMYDVKLNTTTGVAPMLQQAEISFEFAFPFGFSAVLIYAGGLVRMLLKVRSKGAFYEFLKKKYVLESFIISYSAIVLAVQYGLAAYSGALNKWLELTTSGYVWTGLSEYFTAITIRYTIWGVNILIYVSTVTLVMILFVSAAEEAARKSRSNNSALREAIQKMKISVALINITLLTLFSIKVLAMTQDFWGPRDQVGALWICGLWNFVPCTCLLIANIVFFIDAKRPATKFSTLAGSEDPSHISSQGSVKQSSDQTMRLSTLSDPTVKGQQ